MSKIVIEDYSKQNAPKVVLDCELNPNRSYALGRDPANHIYLDHPSISRLHAVLFEHAGSWHIHDLGSSKGVLDPWGNPVHVERLVDGGYFDVGPTRLWFQADEPTIQTPPSKKAVKPLKTVTILECTLVEQDNAWMEGETTEEITRYCLNQQKSLTIGSGTECDLTLPTPDLADLELLLFELNDVWRFNSLDGREVLMAEEQALRGRVQAHEKYTVGPMKFSIFQANLLS